MSVLKIFKDLGNHVANEWSKAKRDYEAFPDIALDAITAFRALEEVDVSEIVMWLMAGENLPDQSNSEFGQPPVHVYVGEGFRIEVLFWMDASTAIHEHAFGGAFGVLSGSSVHSTYKFEHDETVSRRFLRGRIVFQSSELLRRGNARKILADDRFIHSLFHLDRPSVSLVVRTSGKMTERPQYEYKTPFLALDTMKPQIADVTQVRMLGSLFSSDIVLFWKAANEIVTGCDPWMIYQVLYLAYSKAADGDNWNRLLENISQNEQHKRLLDYILPCIVEEARRHKIMALRTAVHDPADRFVLAVLLNVPTRDQIDKLIALRFPAHDPGTLMAERLGSIFSEKRMGLRLTPFSVSLLKLMLSDQDFENARPILQNSIADEEMIRDAWKTIQSVDMFRPLFNKGQAGEPEITIANQRSV
jgi:hypothetical protein